MELSGLIGTNPLGFLASLGVLDAITRQSTDSSISLNWTDSLVPHALINGIEDKHYLLELLDKDRLQWVNSQVLTGASRFPLDEIKPSEEELQEWADEVYSKCCDLQARSVADLWCALVAEGALAKTGDTKPTHLHFLAGNQKFLQIVRELSEKVTVDLLEEAVFGPWRYDSKLPNLRWDVRGERIYALTAKNPSVEKAMSVPGANWLAFLGLRFFPVALVGGSLRTTGCEPNWKKSSFTWPLWNKSLNSDVIRSVIASSSLKKMSLSEQRARGISNIYCSPIRRTDQGGYGTFGAPGVVLGEGSPMRSSANHGLRTEKARK